MRYPAIFFLLLLTPLTAGANAVPPMQTVGAAQAAQRRAATLPWQYPLSDAIQSKTAPDGRVSYALALPVVDSLLRTLSDHAGNYPPQFDNDAERADAADKLTRLIEVFVGLDTGDSVDLNILRREAFAYSLACNLDLPNACPKTMQAYERLLKRTPDEPAANYLYGAFLAGLPPKQREAVNYLEKSLALGVKRANYTLGVLYLSLGEKQKALDHLQKYAADFPDDANTPKLIDAIKTGKVKAVPVPPAATHVGGTPGH